MTVAGIFDFSCSNLPPNEAAVVSLSGREAVNDLYAIDLVLGLSTLDEDGFAGAVMGKRATVWIRYSAAGARPIHGVISAVTSEERSQDGRRWVRARLVPRLWTLSLRQNSRIFQDLNVQQIVDVLFAEHDIARVWRLGRDYPSRQYCVQYQETDEQFVRRILAEEGILFFFEHPSPESRDGVGEEVTVFADDAQRHRPILGDPQLEYRQQPSGDGALSLSEHHVTSFRTSTVMTPTSVTLRDYDFRRPLLDLTATAGGTSETGVPLEIYDHHAEYDETDVGAARARVQLEQLQAHRREAEGASLCRRLAAGHQITLAGHPTASLDGTWTVTAVEHDGRYGDGESGQTYMARFRAVPFGIAFRPSRPPRILRQTQETALVVGPPGHEVYVDPFGRIKVQFHWDRYGRRDDRSSCWIRVAQAWAGSGWGHQFIPRIGMEVVVSFIGGDQDRPLVTGCVNNAMNPSVHGLPDGATRSGIRTRSIPGGGASNEIAFEDRAGSELLLLNAAKDHHENVAVDRRATIGRDDRVEIGGDLETEVRGRRIETTLGGHSSRVAGDGHFIVEGPLSVEARSGSSVAVRGDGVTRVEGSSFTRVRGDTSLAVLGDQMVSIGRDHASSIAGTSSSSIGGDARVTVDGVATLNATEGLTVAVGTLRDPRPAYLALSGGLSLTSSGRLDIQVEEELRLQVGKTKLILTRDTIRLESGTIEVSADSVLLNGGGAGLALSGSVKISGSTVKASSQGGAVLELDGVAKLDGPLVHLRPGAAAEAAARAKREEQAKTVEKETIVLYDRGGDPIQDAPYEVSLPGYLDVGVASAAAIEIPKFPDVERCTIRWSRPTASGASPPGGGTTYEFESEHYLQVEHPDPDEKLRRQLANLGFAHRTLAESVSEFQLANGREYTGIPDDVRAEVDALHSSNRAVKRHAETI